MIRSAAVELSEALALGPPPSGRLSIPVLERGELEVRLYTPRQRDDQTPHPRDEVYVVARGSATFHDHRGEQALSNGALVFVAANEVHHFSAMSDDFAVWVMFYGPAGGALTKDR